MKILVTGGAGFIGSNFVHYWLKNHPEDELVNLDALTYAGHLESLKDIEGSPNYLFLHGDITNPEDVEKAMAGVDVVVHFAAESHVDRSIIDPMVFVKTNVLGTNILLDREVKNKIKAYNEFENKILLALDIKPMTTDEIARETKIEIGKVNATLAVMELNKKVRNIGSKFIIQN